MYAKSYKRCRSGVSELSSNKFIDPDSCETYGINHQVKSNVVLNSDIKVTYKFACNDIISNLSNDFKNIIKSDTIQPTNKVDHDSRDTNNLFNPMHWGPGAWRFLHAISFAYPENPTLDEKKAAESFFESLRELLPCKSCKNHYIENINTMPVNVSSRDTLTKWVVDLHNIVNTKLGKNEQKYQDVAKLYDIECKDCDI